MRHLTDRDTEAEGIPRTFKVRSIVAPVYQFVQTKTGALPPSLPPSRPTRSRKSTFINHVTENLEIPPSERAKRFHVSQFPMAVGRTHAGVPRV